MKRKRSETPIWKRILGGFVYVLFLSAVFMVAAGVAWVRQSPLLTAIITERINPRPPEEVFGGESLTLLLLGCDQDVMATYSEAYRRRIAREFRETGVRPTISRAVGRAKARTDMMLVARLDFKNNRISGVSIPRDMQVDLPGYRPMKINAFYSLAPEGQGEILTKAAVEYLLPGVHIDRVVTLDYAAFEKVVDMVGGVPVFVEKDMRYVDVAGGLFIDLEQGRQILDGYDAMGFVRFRHDDSDFERQKRQKEFLVSLKQKILSGTNLKSLPQVLEQAKLVLGGALSDSEIAGLAGFAQRVPPSNIKLGMVPAIEQRHTTNLLVDKDKLDEVLAEHGLLPSYQAYRGN